MRDFKVTPASCLVDEMVILRVTGVTDRELVPGAVLTYMFPPSWTAARYSRDFTKELQSANPNAMHYVAVTASGARFDLRFERLRLASGYLDRHRRVIVATLAHGELQAGSEVSLTFANTTAPWVAEAGKMVITVEGEEVSEPPTPVTKPLAACQVKVIVPSLARPREPFRVRIVSLDPFWNLSSSKFENEALKLEDGTNLEEELSFVGKYETELALEEGVFRLTFRDAVSNPVRVAAGSEKLCWGDLHAHDGLHDCGLGEDPYWYGREVACLDFMALADDYRRMAPDFWELQRRRAQETHDPPDFTVFLAYEAGFKSGGDYNVIFRHGQGQIFDVTDESMRDIRRLAHTLDPAQALVIPHHMGIVWGYVEYDREDKASLLEIYSHHGQSERYEPDHVLAYEFNRMRERDPGTNSWISKPGPHYARDAWAMGRRLGVIASSDDHMGQPGRDVSGLAAVFAPSNTRGELFDALKARRCYATTGQRLILDFKVNGHQMGQEITAHWGEELTLEVEVHGTDEVASVEVCQLRFGSPVGWETFFRVAPQARDVSYSLEDRFAGDVMYYLRVSQMRWVAGWPVFAWSSPIWVIHGEP